MKAVISPTTLKFGLLQAALVAAGIGVIIAGGNVGIVAFNARLILILLSVLTLLVIWQTRAADRLMTPLDLGWLALLAATFISVIAGLDPRRSIEAWIFPFALSVIWFYGVIALLRTERAESAIFRAMLIMGGIVLVMLGLSLYATAAHWHSLRPPDESLFPPEFRPFAVLDNPNVLAGFLAVLLPAALGYRAYAKSRIERRAIDVGLLGGVIALYVSGSRTGQAAAVLGVGVTIALIALRTLAPITALCTWLYAHRTRAIALSAVVLGGLIAVVAVLAFETLAPNRAVGASQRLVLWRIALTAIGSRPLFGIGPGGFSIALLGQVSVPPALVERHAHNLYLNLFAESGLVGLIALIGFMVGIGRMVRLARRAADPATRPILAGSIGGVVAFGLAGLFDDPLLQAAPLFAFITLLAVIAAHAPPIARSAQVMRWTRRTISGGAGLITAIAALLMILYAFQWLGATGVNPGILEAGAAIDSGDALIHAQSALVWANAASAGDSSALDQAIAAYQTAIRLDPKYAVHRLNLAMLLRRKGDLPGARDALAAAVNLAPESAVMHLNNAIVLEESGQPAAAIVEYQRTLTLEPRWRDALFWQATPTRSQTWRDGQDMALNPDRLYLDAIGAGDAARVSGDIDTAITAYARAVRLAANTTDRLLAQGLIAFAEGGVTAARYDFNAAIYTSGLEVTRAYLYLGDLEGVQGNTAAMRTAYETAYARFDRYSTYGPGHLGEITYAVNAFARFGYVSDYLPDVMLLDITPFEAADFIKLAQFHATDGDIARARQIYRRILRANPGYAPAQDGLGALPP